MDGDSGTFIRNYTRPVVEWVEILLKKKRFQLLRIENQFEKINDSIGSKTSHGHR